MEHWSLIFVPVLFIQSVYTATIRAPGAPPVNIPGNLPSETPLDNLPNLTPQDAKVLEELQRLRENGERFQAEATSFIQSLPNRLSEGFVRSHDLFRVLAEMFSNAVSTNLQTVAQSLQSSGRVIGDNARNLALQGLRTGQSTLNNGVEYGMSALERARANGNALLQNGVNYLNTPIPSLQVRALKSEMPAGSLSQPLNTDLDKSKNLPDSINLPDDMNLPDGMRLTDDVDLTEEFHQLEGPESLEYADLPLDGDGKEYMPLYGDLSQEVDSMTNSFLPTNFDFDSENLPGRKVDPSQVLATRDEKPVSTVLTENFTNVGSAGSNAFKSVTSFASGGIVGLLDALSSVLTTTSDVGTHARNALSTVNKSGARAVSSVFDTTGNLVSGALDKTGSVVDSMKIGGVSTAPVPAKSK